MADNTTYPPIEPNIFDLIVLGTGLPESIVAAAASTAGKTVLHLDPNSFYGSHYSSHTLTDLTDFLTFRSTISLNPHRPAANSMVDEDYTVLDLQIRAMYSEVEFASHSLEPMEQSRKFSLDVSGPRILYCADSFVDLIIKSGASQYVDFTSVDASFVGDANGKFSNVPDSRSAIFKDRSLSLTEKNQLMRFFKLVQQHLASSGESEDGSRINEEDLQKPFVDYLKKMRLPQKIKSSILYAIAMADYDQDNVEGCKEVLTTKNIIDRLALYNQSVGRFSNAPGALIYPIYGQGELSQAFCRRAAVKGSIYVLRMPVIAMLMDKGGVHYKGVRLASGQDIFSQQLLFDPSFMIPTPLSSSLSNLFQESALEFTPTTFQGKVARGICITRRSLVSNVLSLLMIYPPRSLYPEQATAIRVLQIGSNAHVCPSDMFVLYISALCDDANEGKKLLHAAVDALFAQHKSEEHENNSPAQSEDTEELKPSLLWSALYIQELSMGSFEVVGSCFMPDGSLNYSHVLHATTKLFQKMYPGEEFFPEAAIQENPEEEAETMSPDS